MSKRRPIRRKISTRDYQGLLGKIEVAGFFSTFLPHIGALCCASRKEEYGLTGVSFWVAKRKKSWYVATFSPRIYRVPDADKVGDLAVAILRRGGGTPYDFKPEEKERFALVEISEEEFDSL